MSLVHEVKNLYKEPAILYYTVILNVVKNLYKEPAILYYITHHSLLITKKNKS